MTRKAPGKSHRKGLTFMGVADRFRDEDTAREWIESVRWPQGPYCPYCGSFHVQCSIKHKTMTHRCRDCPNKAMFTVRTGSVMEGSKLKHRAWAVGIYLFPVNIKGVSSIQFHRELGIEQKTAWFMLHRLWLAFEEEPDQFAGPMEADETHMGGKRKDKSKAKRKELTGRDAVDMKPVAGAKDRETNKVRANVVERTDAKTLQGFVKETAAPGAKLYKDEHGACQGIADYEYEAVNHSVGEHVRDMASTNGIESFWAMLNRGHQGFYHKFSSKHLDRYVQEFSSRHNRPNVGRGCGHGRETASLL